ncbi:LCP family protein [Erysipelothrix sp. HDW6C]|uniref:LCP family protein n=1 Tax=Erysipelothrix sp. HDW6C TaxID=2714930 RepID=UPI00140CCB55|nr:LCP family protein [Erysipelothrix sp. HDW6C]QIK69384.1 LCP family protein [Erysipelothrix sp. HDW6C]
MAKQRRKRRSFIFDIPLVGMLIVLMVNVVVAAVIILAGRYIKIHTQYFMLGIAVLMVVALILDLLFLIGFVKRVSAFRRLTIYFGLIVIAVGGVGTYYLYKTDNIINQIINLTAQESVEYVVVSFDKNLTTSDMDHKKLGYISSIDPTYKEVVKESVSAYSQTVELVEYKNSVDLLKASQRQEIAFAALPKTYKRLSDDFAQDDNPLENIAVLFPFKTEIEQNSSTVDVLKEPFTLLMLGNNEDLSDSIILATFNPKTLRVTMTSLARDSFVPIACRDGERDKLNHSRGESRQCIIDTVENYLDEEIDFYFETDFYALVKIVDALGGLDIESPVTFAGSFPLEGEYDEYGEPVYEGITVPAGLNHLDGKQVLTFARERHNIDGEDFGRQMNQQYVIKEVATKIISTRNVNTLVNVLDAAKDNVSTNLSVNDITALMGYAIQSLDSSPLTPMETFRIVSTQIAGDDDVRPNGAMVIIPYLSQMQNVRDLIDINVRHEPKLLNNTSFEFSYTDKYNAALDFDGYRENEGELYIGQEIEYETPSNNNTSTSEKPSENGSVVVRDFSGWSDEEISSWGSERGIAITFGTYSTSDEQFNEGQFWSQSVTPGETIYSGDSIHIDRVVKVGGEQPVDDETDEERNDDA